MATSTPYLKLRLLTSYAVLIVATIFFNGCAPPPEPATFYPPPPDAPRFQYLTSFQRVQDVKTGLAKGLAADAFAFRRPFGVAFFADKLYATDASERGFAIIDPKLKEFRFITSDKEHPESAFRLPSQLHTGPDGTKYIADSAAATVLAYDANDKYLRTYRLPAGGKTGGVHLNGEQLLVGDINLGTIHIFDRNSGELTGSFDTDTPLKWPTDIDIDSNNNVFITDTANFSVIKFSPTGKFLHRFGAAGDTVGSFARPKSAAVSADGLVYIVDSAFSNVQVFAPDGTILGHFAGTDGLASGLVLPSAIAISYDAVATYQKFAAPGFELEYVIAVSSAFSPPRINIYGFGKMAGVDYN
jgi:DNA-binding beta-propeller fold protein YncE